MARRLCILVAVALLATTIQAATAVETSPVHAAASHEARRLSDGESPFKGKLNCTFDLSAPFNLSNPSQHFVIDCKEITGPASLVWLWILLGTVGGPILIALLIWVYCQFDVAAKVRRALAQRRDRRAMRAWEREQHAIDRAEAPPKNHAYALA